MSSMRKTNDDFERAYNSVWDLLDSAAENDAGSIWERIQVNQIKATPLPNTPLLVESTKSEFNIPQGVDNDTIRDTMEVTQLLFGLNGENQLVRNSAVRGLLSRARVFGSALNKVDKSDFCNIINTCCNVFSDKALVLVRHGKVTAIHSGDERDYSVLPISELLDKLLAHLDDKFPGYNFIEGVETHELTVARFEMPNQANDLLKDYFDAIKAHGGSPNTDMIPSIMFTSSDTGNSGANLHAMIGNRRYSGRNIRIGTALKLEHRSKATVDDFEENLSLLFAKYIEQTKVLQEMMDVDITYPRETMERVAKKVGLPARHSAQAISDYLDVYGDAVSNAHDLYMALYETVFLARAEGTDGVKLAMMEEAISRALVLDWTAYDFPQPKSGAALTGVSASTKSAA